MRFTKMHGAGNDYVYIDAFRESLPANLSALAVAMSDRHRGIGSDGMIVIEPSSRADARMRMWNADGSPAEMCGNGIRCVAKYLYDRHRPRRNTLTIETARGVLTVEIQSRGHAEQVRVNLGTPILEGDRIPTTLRGTPPLDQPLTVTGERLAVTCVSMGNPHAVVVVEELSDELVEQIGPALERHPAFPNRVNVELVQVLSVDEICLRVWERGAGETLACGTGAAAAVVATVLQGRTERNVLCHLPGGDLRLEWSDCGNVFLTGPAVEVFEGEWTPAAAISVPLHDDRTALRRHAAG